MKKILISMTTLSLLLFTNGFGQGFVKAAEADALGGLFGNECFLKLGSGDEIHGIFAGGTFFNNGFSRITIKLENSEKQIDTPDQLVSLLIKSSDLLKLKMIAESGTPISKMENTDFDSKLKVFAEPTAKTGGFSIEGVQLTGGEEAAYLFVKRYERALMKKKGSYTRDLEEQNGDCPDMLRTFKDARIRWEDVALKTNVMNNQFSMNQELMTLCDSSITYLFTDPTDSVFYSKSHYGYDSYGNRTLEAYYIWDTNINNWVGSYKSESTYDPNGNRTLEAYYIWDTNINNWVGSYKSEITYDSNGNITSGVSYCWDLSINDWTGTFRIDVTYDSNGDIILHVFYVWDLDIDDWAKSEKTYYYYSCKNPVSAKSVNLVIAKVYPNPATDYLIIDFQDEYREVNFELFDIHGRRVLLSKVLSGERINIQELTDGVYIYYISTSGNRESGKIIKR